MTGASGFVGSELTGSLASANVYGLAVSRRPLQIRCPNWQFVPRCEILTPGSHTFDSIHAVIHLEVKQHVQTPTDEDMAEFHEVNVQGTAQWLNFCSYYGIKKFVFFSTIKAARLNVSPFDQKVIDETAPGPGETSYGQSKWRAEQLVRKWCAEEPNRSALILRPSVVYGPRSLANVFAMVKALDKRRFFLVGQNTNVKSLVSLDNLCAAVIHLLREMKPGVEVYNIVDRESYSVRDLAGMISRALGRSRGPTTIPISVAKILARVGDGVTTISRRDFPLTSNRLQALLESTHFSCEKLLSTGFVHPQTTEEGITKMVEWYKAVGRSR